VHSLLLAAGCGHGTQYPACFFDTQLQLKWSSAEGDFLFLGSLGIMNASPAPAHRTRPSNSKLVSTAAAAFPMRDEQRRQLQLSQHLQRSVMANYASSTASHRDWLPNTSLACSVAPVADFATRNHKGALPRPKREEISLVLHAKLLLEAPANQRRRCLCKQQRIVFWRAALFTPLSCRGNAGIR
jgi:hypothetical protein